MKKIETIWHEILFQAINHQQFKFTQQALAQAFGYSLSTVNYALNIPTQLGAIRKTSKFFILQDWQKLLLFWASLRRLEKDIIYKTYLAQPVAEIEGLAPDGAIFACFSAAVQHLGEPAADYEKVYFYFPEDKLEQIQKRFPACNGQPNIFILKKPALMAKYGQITSLPQTYVDLWNLKDWYAKDFIKELEIKINGILS